MRPCKWTTCFEWCEEEYCKEHSHIVNAIENEFSGDEAKLRYANVKEDKK